MYNTLVSGDIFQDIVEANRKMGTGNFVCHYQIDLWRQNKHMPVSDEWIMPNQSQMIRCKCTANKQIRLQRTRYEGIVGQRIESTIEFSPKKGRCADDN